MTKTFKMILIFFVCHGATLASDAAAYFYYKEHPYFDLNQVLQTFNCHEISPFEFKNERGTFKFIQNSGLFYRHGELLAEFDYPAILNRGQSYVPLDGLLKTSMYWSPRSLSSGFSWRFSRRIKNIVIDPGHGGKDFGTHPGSVAEKDVNLRMSKILAEILTESGYQVKLTRYSDTFLTKRERVMKAGLHSADLFVSIHANSSPYTSARGMEVFFLKDVFLNDQLMQWIHTFPEPLVVQKYIHRDFNEHMHVFKASLADHLKQIPNIKYRGNKYGKFYVLRNNFCPSALIELGFLSNPQEQKLLTDYSHLQQIARKIVDGINEYAEKIRQLRI